MKFYDILRVPCQITISMFFSYVVAIGCARGFTGEPPQLAALWAAISGLLVIQASFKETVDAFKVRILGSLIGSIGAILCFMLLPGNVWSITFAVMIIAAICAILKFEKHLRLACVTLVLLLLIHDLSPHQSIFYFALWRLFDSILGSLVAVCVVWGVSRIMEIRKSERS